MTLFDVAMAAAVALVSWYFIPTILFLVIRDIYGSYGGPKWSDQWKHMN